MATNNYLINLHILLKKISKMKKSVKLYNDHMSITKKRMDRKINKDNNYNIQYTN